MICLRKNINARPLIGGWKDTHGATRHGIGSGNGNLNGNMVEGYGPADSSKTLNGCTRHKADICHSFFSDHYQLLSHAQQSGQLEPNVTYSGSGFWIWTLGPRISDLESPEHRELVTRAAFWRQLEHSRRVARHQTILYIVGKK